jgi:hypothetical protein
MTALASMLGLKWAGCSEAEIRAVLSQLDGVYY